MRKTRRSILAGVAAGSLALALAACGSAEPSDTDGPDAGGPEGAWADIVDMMPQEILDAGVIKFASPLTTIPLYYYEEGKNEPVGYFVDILDTIAERLGLETEWQQVPFPGIPPLLLSGSVDIGAGHSSSTPANEDAFTVIGTNKSTTHLVSFSDEYQELTDACGLRVGSTSGGNSAVVDFPILAKACADAGLPAPELSEFPAFAEVLVAISAGRLDGAIGGAVTGVPRNPPGMFSGMVGAWPFNISGITIAPDREDLVAAMEAAINLLIAEGTYHEIMAKWEVAEGLWLDERTYVNYQGEFKG